ncbi:helix-turn-helix transcriptional regulator, partial [Klebsiella pneumoniae]|uniref:helix-turn-helix transcriptional regulator n=5 Tax=Klebsiella pneumoniae TaxID=573 RepID=UPI001F0ACFED
MNSNNQVKQLRLQRAWSQEQLAEMAGLSVRTIQRIENGERPGLETLSALAAVFEVTVAEIGGEARREDAPGQEASLDLRIEEAKARVHQGVVSENGIYGHSRFCNTDFDDKLACLNLSG